MEGMQAYGAGKAGGAFDPVTFFQQPQTILRIVSWVSGRSNMEAEKYRKISLFVVSYEWLHRPLINSLIIPLHMSKMGFN